MAVLLKKIVFPILLLSCTTAFAAKQDQVTACLQGRLKNQACYSMIANYWKHVPTIERVACSEGVDPRLMKSLIAYESRYKSSAVSSVQATGLTQVMPATARGEFGLSRNHLYHPETSVRAGARYLTKMYRQFGRLDLALAAYNAGPGRVKGAGNRVPAIRETQDYVRNITSLYAVFKEKYPGNQCSNGQGQIEAVNKIQETQPNIHVSAGSVALPSKRTFGQYGKRNVNRQPVMKDVTVSVRRENLPKKTGLATVGGSDYGNTQRGIYSN